MGSERFWMLMFFGLLGVCVGWFLSEHKVDWLPAMAGQDYAEVRIEE